MSWVLFAGLSLAEDGVVFGVVASGEGQANVAGGLATGARFLDNLDVTAEVDGAEALGVEGLALFAYLLYDNGAAISELTGAAQGTSNIEAPRALRRYELWADQRFGAHDVRVGFLDLNAEFDAVETASLFLNPSHGIGPDFAQTGDNGPSIFPNAALGARYRGAVGPVAAQVALFEATPGDPAAPERSAFRWSKAEGFLVVAELSYFGERVRKATIGRWAYDHRVVPRQGGASLRTDLGLYGFVDVRLVGDGSSDGRALYAWGRVGLANGAVHDIDHYEGGGLVLRAPFANRYEDALGVSVASAHFADGGRESIFEATGRAPLGRLLALQPDVQVTVHPGGDAAIPSAITVGVRAELAWSSAL